MSDHKGSYRVLVRFPRTTSYLLVQVNQIHSALCHMLSFFGHCHTSLIDVLPRYVGGLHTGLKSKQADGVRSGEEDVGGRIGGGDLSFGDAFAVGNAVRPI